MSSYNPSEVEAKWQKIWAENGSHTADLSDDSKPKYYNLVMFPYPSGDKLHVGHWYNFGPADSWGRYMKMKGHNVLQPMGFDSFGLPAENYAIKTGVAPAESIATNVATMRKQLSAMGAMWDWDKEVVTSTPEYYKWTQWVFLKLYEAGLAYKKKAAVNWCPSCQTVLANEQVVDGICERCKNEVVKKDLEQWFFKISDYAEKLLDYEGLDWPEKTILMQKHWIGRSTGSEIDFEEVSTGEKLKVYTTRIDTLFGCTYMVVAPEHDILGKIVSDEQKAAVAEYVDAAVKKTDIERSAEGKEKTGVFTGAYAINPVNGRKVEIWVSDYVLGSYGTGAVMAVPAHDERDFEFAEKYGLEVLEVVKGRESNGGMTEAYTEDGALFNSGEFDGMSSEEARKAITAWLEGKNAGEFKVNYRLRDWLISRQRYWGAPIPIVYDPEGKAHAVPEEHLPWTLPEDVDFVPDGTAPLARSEELKARTEKIFGEGWTPEVDTMDTFMCSSWYFLRYPDNKNTDKAFDKAMVDKWLPVDMYIGGPEHACMHLLYARFVHRALYDLGEISVKEPFKRLVHQGMVTKDGAKMSKSKGNVVSPDEFVEKYGADVFRMYLMFMGPFTQGGDWNDKGITGIARFVDRFFKMIEGEAAAESEDEKRVVHKLIKKVTEDMEAMQFNTCVAALMEFTNYGLKNGVSDWAKNVVVRLIAPLAPHLAEECHNSGESVFLSEWPEYDESLVVDDKVTIGVQVNGKVRGELDLAVDTAKEEALTAARELENVAKYLEEGNVVKEIYVPGKIIGFVVK